jgi:UDP-N-acetylglucosamine:LPS N-acetylglucosamine transferase
MLGSATAAPRKVVIISAQMGEGHNAAAQALTEVIEDCWPGCDIERLDTMELRGTTFARAARRAYELQLSVLPWSYAAFYHALSRSDLFAGAARTAIGAFFGRDLSKALGQKDPDVVISTYPFGSAALHWLRSKQRTGALTVTYVPAFHVHPLWAYKSIDLHFVMYDSAATHARMPGFDRSMRLGAPPVSDDFGKFQKEDARRDLSLPADDFIVLMTGGAWGLGNIAAGVEALVRLSPPVHVVAVCGRNARLQSDMQRVAQASGGQVTVAGYVRNMPEFMAAADVVVTNGAGVTVLEALRTPRPVVAFAPLAGHGTASTAEMVRRDLALEARDVESLAMQVRRLRTEPALASKMEAAGAAWAQGRYLRASVAEIKGLYVKRTGEDHKPSS